MRDDWPYHVQQPEEERYYKECEDWRFPDRKNYNGLPVFEVYCPACGQKIMFDFGETPTVTLKEVDKFEKIKRNYATED